MKLYIKVTLLSLSMLSLHAELLIIKKTDNGFAALDESDEINKHAISDIMLNYQWPMVIANSSLTEQERDQLLAPDQLYAQEIFITRKLQEINPTYDVIFIPTTIYELFILSIIPEYFNPEDCAPEIINNNSLDQAAYTYFKNRKNNLNYVDALNITDKPLSFIYEQFYKVFKNANNIFYPHAFFHVNNALGQFLFNSYPELTNDFNSFDISDELEKGISSQLIDTLLPSVNMYESYFQDNFGNRDIYIKFKEPKQIQLFKNVILQEYKARILNKELLFRGATSIMIDNGNEYDLNVTASLMMEPKTNTEYEINTKRNAPLSLSLGNSLLAGFVKDPGAMASTYLSRFGGYIIFINKKDYIEHNISNLFLITPLSCIAALFSQGECFHPRSKPAMTLQDKLNHKEIKGFWPYGVSNRKITIKDPFGILITVRDPWRHAEIFSKYVTGNMIIMNLENDTMNRIVLTNAEQKAYDKKHGATLVFALTYKPIYSAIPSNLEQWTTFYNALRNNVAHHEKWQNKPRDEQIADLLSNQEEATQYYKAMKLLKPYAVKASQKFKESKFLDAK